MYAVIEAHLCQLVIVCQEILELKHKYTTMTFELFLMGKSNVRGIRQHTNVHRVGRGWGEVWLDYVNNLWWSDSRIWAMGRRKRRWKENRERRKGKRIGCQQDLNHGLEIDLPGGRGVGCYIWSWPLMQMGLHGDWNVGGTHSKWQNFDIFSAQESCQKLLFLLQLW